MRRGLEDLQRRLGFQGPIGHVEPEDRRKLSSGKATWPGAKQVWRRFDRDGRMARDIVSTADDVQDGQALLQPVMRQGRRRAAAPGLAEIRQRAARSLALLPEPLRRLETMAYPVEISGRLRRLAEEVDRRLAHEGLPA